MAHSYPVSELGVEQLVRALAQVLNPDSPLKTKLLDLRPQEIYGVERDLSEVLQAIRAIRNMSVPVNRLPPEIFSRILEDRTRERELVPATHVCQRYWRSTLISAPSLWECFRFRSGHDLDRTLTYLERSKSAPIDIAIDRRLSPDPKVFKYLAPHLARTRSLIMQGSYGIHGASLLFCNPAPSLKLLKIHSRQGFAPLSENFLGQQAPSLNFVNFTGICPTFESLFPLPNLVEFNLHLPEGTGLFRVDAMFRFLSGCPRLRKVRINIPDETLQGIAQGQVISLESLVELGYAHNPGGRVLPCLKLPQLEQLQVSSSLEPVQVQKLDDILPYDSRRLLAGIKKCSIIPRTTRLRSLIRERSRCIIGYFPHYSERQPLRSLVSRPNVHPIRPDRGPKSPGLFPREFPCQFLRL